MIKKYIIIIIIAVLLISSCSKRVHVITEQDGERVINWYSDK